MTQPKDDGMLSNIVGSSSSSSISSPPKLSKLLQVDPLIKDLFMTRVKTSTNAVVEGQRSSSSTSSSIIDDIFVIPKKIQFELPNVSMQMQSLTKYIDDLCHSKIDSVLMNNTQVLVLGATLGAAVSTGVFIGMFSVGWMLSLPAPTSAPSTTPMSTSSTSLLERISSSIRRRLFWYRYEAAASSTSATVNDTVCNTKHATKTKRRESGMPREEKSDGITQSESGNDLNGDDDTTNTKRKNNNVAILKSHQVIIIQGNPIIKIENETRTKNNYSNSSMSTSREHEVIMTTAQYRSCLDSISASLNEQSLQWNNVGNVSAKLVSASSTNDGDKNNGNDGNDYDGQNAKLFRTILNDYITTRTTMTKTSSSSTTTAIYQEGNAHNSRNTTTLVSVSFVTRLEDKHSKIQVEVLASPS